MEPSTFLWDKSSCFLRTFVERMPTHRIEQVEFWDLRKNTAKAAELVPPVPTFPPLVKKQK